MAITLGNTRISSAWYNSRHFIKRPPMLMSSSSQGLSWVVTVREAADQEVPPVFYNTEVKLRYFLNGENVVLHGMICGSSPRFWRVDRLGGQFTPPPGTALRPRTGSPAALR